MARLCGFGLMPSRAPLTVPDCLRGIFHLGAFNVPQSSPPSRRTLTPLGLRQGAFPSVSVLNPRKRSPSSEGFSCPGLVALLSARRRA
jgi:hypothetical protein